MTFAKNAYRNYSPAGMEEGILPIVENSRVLEIGFGSGTLLRALQKKGNDVYGVDAGADIVNKAKEQGFKNVQLIDMSEQNLPFENGFFDAVYSYEVFEHLTNPHRMFYEVRRVLKSGQNLYFSVPTQENTMGYGPGRHSFVYPGLLEKRNLERFFMQMYFGIEHLEETSGGLMEHRFYILKNIKLPPKPDIVEVITGDYSVEDLYSHMLSGDGLKKEIETEIEPYLRMMERFIEAGHWQMVDETLNILLPMYKDYFPMYIKIAGCFLKNGQAEFAKSLLQTLLANSGLPPEIREKALNMMGDATAGD